MWQVYAPGYYVNNNHIHTHTHTWCARTHICIALAMSRARASDLSSRMRGVPALCCNSRHLNQLRAHIRAGTSAVQQMRSRGWRGPSRPLYDRSCRAAHAHAPRSRVNGQRANWRKPSIHLFILLIFCNFHCSARARAHKMHHVRWRARARAHMCFCAGPVHV